MGFQLMHTIHLFTDRHRISITIGFPKDASTSTYSNPKFFFQTSLIVSFSFASFPGREMKPLEKDSADQENPLGMTTTARKQIKRDSIDRS
jgi:hypothetical protein